MRYILTGVVGLFLSCTVAFATDTEIKVLKWGPSTNYGPSVVTATAFNGQFYRLTAGGHVMSLDAIKQDQWQLMPGIAAIPKKVRAAFISGARCQLGTNVRVAVISTPSAKAKVIDRYSDTVSQELREHRFHSKGDGSPNTHNEFHNIISSDIRVTIVPRNTTLALALAAQNAVLTDRAIALARESGHAKGELRGVTARPLVVINNDNSSGGASANAHAHTGGGVAIAAAQPLTRLCAYRWKCGTYFSDQFGRRWRRISGVSLKSTTPGSFMGHLDGNRFITGSHVFRLQ